WQSEALAEYLERTQQHLITALPEVPVRMQVIVRRMIDERWLSSYATVAGIRARLATMSQRLTRRMDRAISLEITEGDLAEQDQALTADFSQLWPELINHVQQYRLDAKARLAS
ncbi:MAG: ACP phosphodiesterase, partial [Planctomycetota bacterium]